MSSTTAPRPDRPIRIANCSGALTDPPILMYNQAKYGPVDVITGDYLAEATMASNAGQLSPLTGNGWVPTALAGFELSLDIINKKRIKVVINGGARNPKGLAEKVHELAKAKGLKLRVAFVDGDDLMHKLPDLLANKLPHLDGENPAIHSYKTAEFLESPEEMPIISANAYLGYRAIKKGLDEGADIVICGRVADASPVIGAAAWWYGWKESDLDQLAGSLIAGHLIECSTYVTGGNFAGASQYYPTKFVHLGSGIAEVLANGECIITKHEALNGFITPDTVKCQLLYELQGNIYLNSDVKADLTNVKVVRESKNRVHVSGIKGYPPPPTTKLAIFYKGGYQCELLLNANGYAVTHKWDTQEHQFRRVLEEWGVAQKLSVLDFQRVGTIKDDPHSQLESTMYMRIFAQSRDQAALALIYRAWHYSFMSHYPGMHGSLDVRTLVPKPFPVYYPALVSQDEIEEAVTILGDDSAEEQRRYVVGPPLNTEPLAPRESYDSTEPTAFQNFGDCITRPLGDIVLARSGDKGANINIGLFVQTAEQWEWFRSFMSMDSMRAFMRNDWRNWYHVERVEFPEIYAVHFVIYGPLGRGASSTRLLDGLGKGFAEYIRAVHVDIPARFIKGVSPNM